MVEKITHKDFGNLINTYYNQIDENGKKIPLSVVGHFGVGKSTVVKDKAREIAHGKGKKFAEWNKITREQKEIVFKDPSKFFVLIDIRLSEMDTSDIKGLPDFKDGTSVEWKIPFWAKVLEHPDSDGILFFDEINLATPLVISSTYKIIHDRVVNESKINDNWLIIACGNKDDDRAYTHELAAPLKDRMGEVELVAPSIEEFTEWGIKNDMDTSIIAYLNWKPSSLYNVDYDSGQKQTTPRGWARCNALMKGITDMKQLEKVACSAIGEGIAREFIGYLKIQQTVNLDAMIKKPELLQDIKDIGTKYFVISALAERYKSNKIEFKQILKFSEILDLMKNQEFIALLWKLCSKYNKTQFRKDWLSKETDHPLRTKFYKYLKDED